VIGLKGEIKKLIRERGFGFISAEDGREVFFHSSAFEGIDFDALEEGTGVEFNVESGPKGPRAMNVRMIDGPTRSHEDYFFPFKSRTVRVYFGQRKRSRSRSGKRRG